MGLAGLVYPHAKGARRDHTLEGPPLVRVRVRVRVRARVRVRVRVRAWAGTRAQGLRLSARGR